MTIHALETELKDIQSESAIIVSGGKLHILNESAKKFYEIISNESPEIIRFIEKVQEFYAEVWQENELEIIADLFELLEQMRKAQLIEFTDSGDIK